MTPILRLKSTSIYGTGKRVIGVFLAKQDAPLQDLFELILAEGGVITPIQPGLWCVSWSLAEGGLWLTQRIITLGLTLKSGIQLCLDIVQLPEGPNGAAIFQTQIVRLAQLGSSAPYSSSSLLVTQSVYEMVQAHFEFKPLGNLWRPTQMIEHSSNFGAFDLRPEGSVSFEVEHVIAPTISQEYNQGTLEITAWRAQAPKAATSLPPPAPKKAWTAATTPFRN